MPTYQYACTECGHSFDIVQSFSDDSLTVCPECGGRLRKVFNAVGVVFKGSGFYRTDSREKKSATTSAGDSSSKESGTSGGTSAGTPAGSESGTSTKSDSSSKPSSTPRTESAKV